MNRPENVDVTTALIAPTDRVRWGPIFAGLFAALTTLVVLGVLGLAIGLSSYNAGEPARNFGIGAGIWGSISALIAFAVGGWLASFTASIRSRGYGMLNGAMVWVVAIPLLLYLLAGGIGTLLTTAGNVAQAGAQAAGAAVANNPNLQPTAQAAATAIQGAGQAAGQQVTPQQVEQATQSASTGAWGLLLSLVLGFLAATFGGMLGAREPANMNTARTTSRPI
jgi:hypothetical protein